MIGAACSFSADTLVATEEGDRPISEIGVGDRVLAYDEASDTIGYYTVTAVLMHEDPGIEYLTIDGETLETTPEHPFYTEEKEWVPAGELWQGAHVRKADGSSGVVESLTVVQRTQRMYNLTVAVAHTFFVGEEHWLVHNKCGGSLGDLTADEIAEIQSVVDTAGRPLEIVGSSVQGTRRGVGTDLPLGKGPGTRSDIDYIIPPSSVPYFKQGGLINRLPSIDFDHGAIIGTHNPFMGPAIRFEPGADPYFVPMRR